MTYALPSRRTQADGASRTLVVAGDVSLGRLSEFVRLFSSSSGQGNSALLSASHQVLARSDVPGVVRQLMPAKDGVLGALSDHLLSDGAADGPPETSFSMAYGGRRLSLIHI